MFQPTKERAGIAPSAALWNLPTFQTTNERPFWLLIQPLRLRLEQVMFHATDRRSEALHYTPLSRASGGMADAPALGAGAA